MWAFLRRRTLTQWIMVGMVAGVVLGWADPDFSRKLQPAYDIFLRMIKAIIVPLIFSTLVVGIAGHGDDLKKVGRLGIPLPELAAAVVIVVETLGAVCLIIGLLTRFWAACMVVDMAVAILLAVLPQHHVPELEGLLLIGALAIVALGAGPVSLDRLFQKKG